MALCLCCQLLNVEVTHEHCLLVFQLIRGQVHNDSASTLSLSQKGTGFFFNSNYVISILQLCFEAFYILLEVAGRFSLFLHALFVFIFGWAF